jgi:outer membrane protein OmpA-like peptidoglycan-associated protein
MKNRVLILVLMISFAFGGQLMAGNEKANRYFELFKYAKAIPLYKKAVQSADLAISGEATARLADCYRLTNNIPEARYWYSRAVAYENTDPLNYYYLGQAYRTLGKYDEAKAAFLRFSDLKPADERGKILAGFCDKIKLLGTLSDSVIIENEVLLNSKYSDFSPVFYKNGLVFVSDRINELTSSKTFDWTNNGYLDLYYSEYGYDEGFQNRMSDPVRMSNLFNQVYHDGPASFTADQNTIFVTRTMKSKTARDKNNVRTNLFQLFSASLADPKNVKYISFAYNRSTYSCGHPALSNDGKKLIFSSNMPGGFGGSDLYMTELKDGKWSKPVNLGETINTFGSEVFPYWFNDTVLYFSSDGHVGYGGLDLFESHWKQGGWSAPVNLLKPINSSYDDFGLLFKQDQKEGFFSSNRPGGKGADDIYAIHNYSKKEAIAVKEEGKTKPWVSTCYACCYVRDKITMKPLDDAAVFVLNSATSEVKVFRTDNAGYLRMPADTAVLYVAKAVKRDYFDDCITFRFTEADTVNCKSMPRDLMLQHFALNQAFKLENIYYDLNKWDIRADARPTLDQLIVFMKQNPVTIELASYTDSRAADDYNMELSFKRAEAVDRYMLMNGINSNRIIARGYGETRPVNHCTNGVSCTEAEHQANRRTEFTITSYNNGPEDTKVFDTSPFKTGDLVPVQLLGSDFFKGCFSAEVKPAETPAVPVEKPKTGDVKSSSSQKPSNDNTMTKSTAPVVMTEKGSYFSVQIFAVAESKNTGKPDFKGEDAVSSKNIGGYIKYFVGRYTDFSTAMSEKKRLENKFPGAFVVAFKDGNIVTVDELIKSMK